MDGDQTTFHASMEAQSDSYCYIQASNPGAQTEATHPIGRREAMYTTRPDFQGSSEMGMPIPWPQQVYYGYQHQQQLPFETFGESVEETEMHQYPDMESFHAIVQGYLNNLSTKKRDKALVDRHRYSIIARVLKEPRNTAISTAQFRFWVKKMFQLVTLEDGTDVVCHDSKPVAMREDIYTILVQAHKQANHGGRDKTSALARRRYSWIPKELIARFVRHCPYCIARRIGSQSPPTGFLPRTPPGETETVDDTQQPLGDYPYLGVEIKPAPGDKELDLDWADKSADCYLPSSPSTTSPSSSVSGPSSATNLPSCTTALPSSLRTSDTAFQQHVLLSPCGIPAPNWSPSDGQHVGRHHHHRPPSSSFSMCYTTAGTDVSGNMDMTSTPSSAYHHFLDEPRSSKAAYGHSNSIATDYYYGALHRAQSKNQQSTDHFMDRISEIASQTNEVDPFESAPLSTAPIITSLPNCPEMPHAQSVTVSTTAYLDHSSSTSRILDEQRHL